MSHELDELYLTWLYSQIGAVSVKNPANTYWSFAKQLYEKEFVWLVPNDDNRVEDGRRLRFEFIDDYDIDDADDDWLSLGCSMLEMFVALSRRLAFMGGGEARDRFWLFIENLGFSPMNCSDRSYNRDRDLVHAVDEVLDTVIWRTYDYDGSGGIFPLLHPPGDMRRIELWYQMSAYVMEKRGV